MQPARFLAQLAVWGLAFAALNVAVGFVSRNSVPRAVVASIDRSPPVTDIFLGNSLAQAGADPKTFAETRPMLSMLNAGLGSSYAPEHLVLLRRTLKLKPARVYYGFYDHGLFTPAQGGWDKLVGNRSMAYYTEPEISLRIYAANDPIRALQMRIIARLPLLIERQTLWAKVEKMRRRFAQIGFASAEMNRFGRADDFRLLEALDAGAFLRRCDELADSRRPFEPPVIAIIDQTRQAGARLVLVEMPMPKSHRERFYDHPEWSRLRERIHDEARRTGAEYVVASDWVGDDGFQDPLHLNSRGAAEFSRQLAAHDVTAPQASSGDGPAERKKAAVGTDDAF